MSKIQRCVKVGEKEFWTKAEWLAYCDKNGITDKQRRKW